MSVDIDRRLAAILHEGAPPRRDPMFRVRVLQRLEQRRFRRRLYVLGSITGGAIPVALVGIGAKADVTEGAGVVLFCAAAAISILWHAPVVTYFWRRLARHAGVRETS